MSEVYTAYLPSDDGVALYEALSARAPADEPRFVGHLALVEGIRFIETTTGKRAIEPPPRDLERMRARLKTMGAY